MQLNAENYYRAGLERIGQARRLYNAGDSYAYAIYSAGLAVECMLRAFRWSRDPSFEGRHNLLELFRASGLLAIDESRMQNRGLSPDVIRQNALELQSAMSTIVALWSNDYRFASESRLRARMNELRLYERTKGDVLKANCLRLIAAAEKVVSRGIYLWTYGKK